jgi:23S rRNA (adenine2503-C2)-methyltransferase
MPLSEKWVITMSTQYGCMMDCNFCDVPQIKFNGNATLADLYSQFYNAIDCFPDVKYTERLNIHFARMGEPILNDSIFHFSEQIYKEKKQLENRSGLKIEVIHPVLTTSLPRRYKKLSSKIYWWCDIKNNIYNGQAGLQFSINSTNEQQRSSMFKDAQLSLTDLSNIAKEMPDPIGRKYCLNFAYSNDFEINASYLRKLFNPDKFMVKITPIHNNSACIKNSIKTIDGYESYSPYRNVENELKNEGFDVLVFIPSMDEEDGLVTCGNLVLSEAKKLVCEGKTMS